MKFIKNSKILFTTAVVCILAVTGVVLADTIVNNYYGNVDLTQESGDSMIGAVTAIGGVCDGSEPTTQMCNVNVYDIESQTDLVVGDDLTVGDDVTIADDLTVGGNFEQGGGVLAISTTSATRTLTEAEMLANNYIRSMVNAGATFALTLPATSTMTTLMPDAGDTRTWFFENATSSTMALTLTAGTGIRLVASTNAMDVFDATEVIMLDCVREQDTDVLCVISDELVDAD